MESTVHTPVLFFLFDYKLQDQEIVLQQQKSCVHQFDLNVPLKYIDGHVHQKFS